MRWLQQISSALRPVRLSDLEDDLDSATVRITLVKSFYDEMAALLADSRLGSFKYDEWHQAVIKCQRATESLLGDLDEERDRAERALSQRQGPRSHRVTEEV